MLMQHFSASRYFRDEQFVVVSDPRQGLAPRLFAAVEEAGQSVVFVANDTDAHRHAPLMALVEANELQNLAAVQLAGIDGQAIALFGFARVPAAFDARLRRQIELLVPHLYSTFLRVLTNEREVSAPSEGKSGRVITPRQAEILSLIKDGKTNAQIAEMLDCSQWTIKNHIQNILRRLETNSRAHALVQAMRLGILSPD
jgi:transcriptional regulator EpsA